MAMIHVKAVNEDGKVTFTEKHPDHPKGSVFIAGNGKEHEVAETVQVKRAIAQGKLVQVGAVERAKSALGLNSAQRPATGQVTKQVQRVEGTTAAKE